MNRAAVATGSDLVTRRFTEGLSWLHARVGRRLPVQRSRASDHRINARVRVTPTSTALQPTVYLPRLVEGQGLRV